MKILVLGSGLVGSAIIRDLATEPSYHITVCDVSEEALARFSDDARITSVQMDCADPDAIRTLAPLFDIVVGALPGHMGFNAVKAVIEAGRPMVDISFFPEDCFALDALAKKQGVTTIVDCGLAPGLSNLLLGHATLEFDDITDFVCLVGGLPAERRKPFEYTAVFSPIDVLEEYTRPARYIENFIEVIKPALSEIELVDIPGVGTLEAFNTDGLRSLAATITARNMKEKTMRYPGHAELMKILRGMGLFDKEEIDIRGTRVRPIDVTAALMFPLWKLPEGGHDLSAMQVVIAGTRQGRHVTVTHDLLDRYDPVTNTTSMARTTGYTCAVTTRLLASGAITRQGIVPPEFLGMDDGVFQDIMRGLEKRGVRFYTTTGD